MGGGKSHALVGLYMATAPEAFFATELGQSVLEEIGQLEDAAFEMGQVRTVVLSADNMSPGVPSAEFGPATSLFERSSGRFSRVIDHSSTLIASAARTSAFFPKR